MSKPIKPNVVIPSEFAAEGQKSNFSEEKIRSGFNSVARDTLEGDCLNKFIDDTYKGLNYSMDGVDDLYDVADTKANNSAVVHLTGNETISGTKTFSGSISTGGANFVAINGTNIYIKNGTPPVTITALNGHLVEDGNKVIDVTDLATTSTAGIVQPDGLTINVESGAISAPLATLDFINNSKALETGNISSNAAILADITTYAHSTYDSTKFTSYIVGNVIITNDGIASGFNNSPTTNIKITTVPTTNNYTITGEFTTPATIDNTIPFSAGVTVSGSLQLLFSLRFNTNNSRIQMLVRNSGGTNTTIENSNITAAANTSYKFKLVVNNADVSFYINNSLVGSINNFCELLPDFFILGADRGNSAPYSGTVDLKWFSISENSIPVFSGNKTGTDTYTIGGNTVTIPYSMSKTGSKIANAGSRTNITALYNEQGYAPYYTLDEVNGDFTLPQGEIYGMMLNQSVPHIVESYKNGASWYRVWSDGWCEQGGSVYIPGQDGVSVIFLKSYPNADYQVMLTNASYVITVPPGVSPGTKQSNGIGLDYGSAEAAGDVYWETKGYIS